LQQPVTAAAGNETFLSPDGSLLAVLPENNGGAFYLTTT